MSGVRAAKTFVLFLSEGIESRPFVHLEVREAIKANKEMVVIHEEDDKHGKFDFSKWKADAPEDLKTLLDNHQSVALRRVKHEREAFIEKLIVKHTDAHVDLLGTSLTKKKTLAAAAGKRASQAGGR